MNYWKIEKLQSIYIEYLALLETAKNAEKQFASELMGPDEDEYRNPFRMSYDFEKVLTNVRDDVVRSVKRVYNEEYPNVELEKMDFKNLFKKDKHGRHDGLSIDWNGMKLRLLWLETKADELAMKKLEETALRTIPNFYHRTELKPEEILHGKTLHLDGHFYSYDRIDEYRVKEMKKWLSVVLDGARASQTLGNGIAEIKCYKNGRTDIQFDKEEKAKKVAEILCILWAKKKMT